MFGFLCKFRLFYFFSKAYFFFFNSYFYLSFMKLSFIIPPFLLLLFFLLLFFPFQQVYSSFHHFFRIFFLIFLLFHLFLFIHFIRSSLFYFPLSACRTHFTFSNSFIFFYYFPVFFLKAPHSLWPFCKEWNFYCRSF